ncbi:hypothetical protein Fcan01_10621 [Folsomia candida]|uniref:Uncharacterized protein n=1 Tax=Folsomia candida TaxID=158441 RepID=A0A226E7P9_FOLCA|nr:hypothetical protein Fcan01_10621 [Folsomia candida]
MGSINVFSYRQKWLPKVILDLVNIRIPRKINCFTSPWTRYPKSQWTAKWSPGPDTCTEPHILATWLEQGLNISLRIRQMDDDNCAMVHFKSNQIPSLGALGFEFVNTIREPCSVNVLIVIQLGNTIYQTNFARHFIQTSNFSLRPEPFLFVTTSHLLENINPCHDYKYPARVFRLRGKITEIKTFKPIRFAFWCLFCEQEWQELSQKSLHIENISVLGYRKNWAPKVSLGIVGIKILHEVNCLTAPWTIYQRSLWSTKWPLVPETCTERIILASWLQERLNISLHPRPTKDDCAKIHFNFNTIPSSGALGFKFVNTIRYHGFRKMHFFYCNFETGVNSKIAFTAWIRPFHPSVWGTLIFTIVISAVVLSVNYDKICDVTLRSVSYYLLSVVGIFFRQGFRVKKFVGLVIMLHVLFLILGFCYETYFTSHIIVPAKVRVFENFAILLKNGYKLIMPSQFNPSAKNWLKLDLQRLGILDKFNDKLDTVSYKYFANDLEESLLHNPSLKYFGMLRLMWREELDYSLQMLNSYSNSSAPCFVVPDTFINQAMYYLAKLVISADILKHIEIADEAGFLQFWRSQEARSNLAELYQKKRENEVQIKRPSVDFILLRNLISLFIVSCTLIGIGIVVFFIENEHMRESRTQVEVFLNG